MTITVDLGRKAIKQTNKHGLLNLICSIKLGESSKQNFHLGKKIVGFIVANSVEL